MTVFVEYWLESAYATQSREGMLKCVKKTAPLTIEEIGTSWRPLNTPGADMVIKSVFAPTAFKEDDLLQIVLVSSYTGEENE